LDISEIGQANPFSSANRTVRSDGGERYTLTAEIQDVVPVVFSLDKKICRPGVLNLRVEFYKLLINKLNMRVSRSQRLFLTQAPSKNNVGSSAQDIVSNGTLEQLRVVG
jgi:hypothetical protein